MARSHADAGVTLTLQPPTPTPTLALTRTRTLTPTWTLTPCHTPLPSPRPPTLPPTLPPLPPPSQGRLHECLGALGLHLAHRLEVVYRSWLGDPNPFRSPLEPPNGGGPDCEWLPSQLDLPESDLPAFPEFPMGFVLPPLPLLPRLLLPFKPLVPLEVPLEPGHNLYPRINLVSRHNLPILDVADPPQHGAAVALVGGASAGVLAGALLLWMRVCSAPRCARRRLGARAAITPKPQRRR